MRALLLLAHTAPSLVCDIIRNKLGPKSLRIDPKNTTKASIVFYTTLAKARFARDQGFNKDAIFIAVCSPLDAQQIKGALALDFNPTSLEFLAMQLCKFDIIFDLYNSPKQRHKIKFKTKRLLTKIIDLKMSTNIISLGQTLLYDIAVKSKRKTLRKYLINWLSYPANTRPIFSEFLSKQDYKFKEVPKALAKKLEAWQEMDKLGPINYAKFLQEAKGKTNKEIPDIATKYNINAFDGITLCTWTKNL